jgi:hypothetical protein
MSFNGSTFSMLSLIRHTRSMPAASWWTEIAFANTAQDCEEHPPAHNRSHSATPRGLHFPHELSSDSQVDVGLRGM